MIDGMFNSGSMPVLERLVQFTGQRHKVLTDNIANLNTPYFKPVDLDPQAFQDELSRAVDRRRAGGNPFHGDLDLRDTDQLEFEADGVRVRPGHRNENIMFHDQNNRNLERMMQDLVENTMAHNAGVEILKSQFDILKMAIRERV